jgi:hypothetical protein
MYGHFDAIKRRKKLRDETTDARQKRVDDLKSRTSRSGKSNVFPDVDPSTIEEVNRRMEVEREKAQSKERIVYIVAFGIAAVIVVYLFFQYISPIY